MPTDRGGRALEEARRAVIAAERAFAKSMADRDIEAFASWLSEEAIFFTGLTPLRGKAAVLSWWSRYFASKEAPFSWEPDQVEVARARDSFIGGRCAGRYRLLEVGYLYHACGL